MIIRRVLEWTGDISSTDGLSETSDDTSLDRASERASERGSERGSERASERASEQAAVDVTPEVKSPGDEVSNLAYGLHVNYFS